MMSRMRLSETYVCLIHLAQPVYELLIPRLHLLSFRIRNRNIRFLGYGMKKSIRSRLGHCSLTHYVPSLNLKHITIKCFLQRYEIPNLSLSGSRRQFRGKLISVPCQLDTTQHYDNKIRTSLPVIQGYYKY